MHQNSATKRYFTSNIPPLYRYMPLSKIERIESILFNLDLYHNSIHHFNDPFEFKFHAIPPTSKQEFEKYLSRTLISNQFHPKLNRAQRKIKVSDLSKDLYNGKTLIRDKFERFISKVIDGNSKYGICCFSSNRDSLLQWSHYADSHQGICIEFDFKHSSSLGIVPLEIIYQDEYPSINIYSKDRDNLDLLNKSLLTKHSSWSYEGEHRSIKPKIGNHKLESRDQIKSITFGVNSKDEKIKEVIELLKKINFKIPLYKTKRSDRKYELIREPLPN